MTIRPAKYARTPFLVEAIQVTEENMAEVTAWCEGVIRTTHVDKPYIKVDAYKPLHTRQSMAFVGDWVLMTDSGVKVYTAKGFEASFVPYVETQDEFDKLVVKESVNT